MKHVKTIEVICPWCGESAVHTVESGTRKDKRPTKNLDSLIAVINQAGATVWIMQQSNMKRWNVCIHDALTYAVIGHYVGIVDESMYMAIKAAVLLVTDRVISLHGYKQNEIKEERT